MMEETMKKISSNAIEEKTTRADELEVLEPDAADSETTRPTDPTCTTVAHCIVENSADGGSSSPVAEEANMIADTNAIIDNSSTLMMNDSANNMDSIPDTPHNPKASVVSPIVVESLSIPAEKKLEEEEVMAHDICTNAPHDSPHTVHDQPLHKIHPSPSEAVPLTPSWRQQTSSPALRLLSLPVDSLHCIASFLTASDWAKFGQTTTIATPICRDVFTRVRMHGFRCATEVVTAWVSYFFVCLFIFLLVPSGSLTNGEIMHPSPNRNLVNTPMPENFLRCTFKRVFQFTHYH
jgi:hypothetical protein